MIGLAGVESLLVGIARAALGVATAVVLGCDRCRVGHVASGWTVVAALVGLAHAVLTVLVPAWRDHRRSNVVTARLMLDARVQDVRAVVDAVVPGPRRCSGYPAWCSG